MRKKYIIYVLKSTWNHKGNEIENNNADFRGFSTCRIEWSYILKEYLKF